MPSPLKYNVAIIINATNLRVDKTTWDENPQ